MSISGAAFDEEKLSEQELVGLVQNGNEKAAALLVLKMMPLVKQRAAAYVSRSSTDIEDLVQEGLMGLLCAVNTYRSGEAASFKTYATVCINNRIISAVKASFRQKNLPLHNYVPLEDECGAACAIGDSAANPEEHVIAKEEEARIYKFIDENLSAFEHKVLQLFLSGRSYDEIGEITKSSAKSADNALQRVRRKLRAAVGDNK